MADALRQHGAAYLASHTLSTAQAKAWRGIVACRTAALGGQQLACDACGHSHWQYHSCRNRHCPQCGARAKDAWLQGRLAEVLPVPYAHLVFTLPHGLNGLYGAHPRWVIDTLFSSAAQTLPEFAANPRWRGVTNGTAAFSLVLHTWRQDLQRHLHVHAVMACGVLGTDGQWHVPVRKPDFLFPVHALSKVFRGKFMAALSTAHRTAQSMRLDGAEFVRRFLLHVLPTGIKRIRHYGVPASACKADKLRAAREALRMPAANPQAIESARAFMCAARGAHRRIGMPVLQAGALACSRDLDGTHPAAGARRHRATAGTGAAVTRRFHHEGFVAHLTALGAMPRGAPKSTCMNAREGRDNGALLRVCCRRRIAHAPLLARAQS